jgi:hypothetical protein
LVRTWQAGLIVLAASLGLGAPAFAQVDLFSREAVSGVVDLRAAYNDSHEQSWVDGGLGKARAAKGFDLSLAEADLIWRPRVGWNLSGLVVLQVQPDMHDAVGVPEAYVTYKPTPNGPVRYAVKAGVFYPPISQEHEGGAWLVSDSITPSAINTWVGEELRTGGVEFKATATLGGQEVAATVGAFGWNDTSGTLLSMRGWALGDQKAVISGDFPLPPLSDFMATKQAPHTTPALEIDDRVGFYGRLDWSPSGRMSLNAFYYDNRGALMDPPTADMQWAWDTRFWNVGAVVTLDDRTTLKAQAMTGVTLMGRPRPRGWWIDVDYDSAYASLTRKLGDDSAAASLYGRVEWFDIIDKTYRDIDDNAEHGWAFTGAWKRPLTPRATLFVEALHVSSRRNDRERFNLNARQSQTVLQSSLRFAL